VAAVMAAVVMAAVVMAAVVMAIAIRLLQTAEWRSGGPVEELPLSVAFLPYEAGTSFSDGWITVKVGNVEGAIIRGVVVTSSEGHFITLGEPLVAGPSRQFNMFQNLQGYPPTDSRFGPLEPAIGATIPPGPMGLELLIGLRIERDEYAVRDSVTIRYTVGGRKYQTTVPYRFVFCPSTMTEAGCEERFYSSALWDAPS